VNTSTAGVDGLKLELAGGRIREVQNLINVKGPHAAVLAGGEPQDQPQAGGVLIEHLANLLPVWQLAEARRAVHDNVRDTQLLDGRESLLRGVIHQPVAGEIPVA